MSRHSKTPIIIAVLFYALRLQIIYVRSLNWSFQNQVDLVLCTVGLNKNQSINQSIKESQILRVASFSFAKGPQLRSSGPET